MTTYRYGRDGERIDLDDDPAPSLLHACDGGWIGEDDDGRPIPCPECKGEHLARLHAATRRRTEGPGPRLTPARPP